MKDLKKLMALFAVLVIGLFAFGCGDDDDDDEVIVVTPEASCDLEAMSVALADGELGALDAEFPEITVDSIADACLASDVPEEVEAGETAKLVIGTLTLIDEVDGILSLLGGLGLKTSGELAPQQGMNIGDILDGFIDPIFDALAQIDEAAEVMEASGSEWAPLNGVGVSVGSSPTGMIYVRGLISGTWGLVEASLLGGGVDSVKALLDFLLSHDLNFDLTTAISKFGDIDMDLFPGNVPALVMGAQWLFADNPDFLKIGDAETFSAIPDLLIESINEIVPLHTDGTLYGYSDIHVLSMVDNGTAGVIDGGDVITIQFELLEAMGDTEAGVIDPIEVPACDADGEPTGDDDFCIAADIMPEIVRIFDVVVKDSLMSTTASTCDGTAGDGCLKLTELNVISEALGLLDNALPPVVEIDLASFFLNPKGLRDIMLADDGSDAPLVMEGESFGDCEGLDGCDEYVFPGDSVHFVDGDYNVAADGIAPPEEGALDNVEEAHTTYVLPYIQLGSCTVNGALYINLAGFAAGDYTDLAPFPSIWDVDYSLDEVDDWDMTFCDYKVNKLLAMTIVELGFLEDDGEE
jgi:hypothetical protein